MDVRRIEMNPWDFTLYESTEGTLVLKVVFSEGDYKTDVGHFFILDSLSNGQKNVESLKTLSGQIRDEYPEVRFREIAKADITILK